ncbi:DNA repair protein complementing XP-C cells homolog [Periplaneta americana]|uniref:DNA repair protein complementing XP-C cells homolog n=1 Tax=Periplaneta americana TaxID=6978 RepID=UPI0037E7C772
MMSRRSMKRASPSTNVEINSSGNFTNDTDTLKGKRRKLGTKTKRNGVKSSNNVNENSSLAKDESSESSSDEFMRPSSLPDIDTDKFNLKQEVTTSDFTAIEDNILTGVTRLTDSEDSEFEDVAEVKPSYLPLPKVEEKTTEHRPTKSVRKTKTKSDHSRTKSTKKNRSSSKTKTGSKNNSENGVKILPTTSEVNKMDVSELLALGEGSGVVKEEIKDVEDRIHSATSDSEDDISDWEDVGGLGPLDVKDENIKSIIPKEGVEVTLQMPDIYRKRKKKGFDMEAHLRRRLNRVKRELQVLIHKVHLLCWIAHGRYINSTLNSEVLMALSLSFIPSQHCYPGKHTNLDYLEKIVEWFRKTVTVKETTEKNPSLSLCDSLQEQFQSRTAYSNRDLVLMFICVLRTIGVKARLLLSLQPLPLKPPSDEMCAVSRTKVKKEESIVKDEVDDAGVSESTSKEQLEKTKSKSTDRSTESRKESDKKLQNKNQISKYTKKSNTKSSSSSSKSKSHESKTPKKKSDADISDEKMDKLKRTLRERKEVLNKYKDDSDSAGENGVLSQKASVESKKSQKTSVESKKRQSASTNDKGRKKSSEPTTSSTKKESGEKKGNTNKKGNTSRTKTEDDNSDSDFVPESSSRRKSTGKQNLKENSTDSNSESEFEPKKVSYRKKSKSVDVVDRRVLSSDSASSGDGTGVQKKEKKKRVGHDVWTEVFVEEEEKWISVDIGRGKVHCVAELHSRATQPVTYVLAFNNDLTLKDVTCRYCANFTTTTRRLRVDEKWWQESLSPFLTAPTAQDREEDEELNRLMLDRPMPTTLKEFKNHPLYVLRDDLLKFEAIYPPDAPTLGFVRGKPVYARECVHTLHSREIWMKEAKVVRLGEQPYKIVKARPKYDKMSGQFVKDLPLEVFGSWQVEDYIPPPAVDGKVPRNEYGNVELYKPCMLPKGTVHLQVPGLNRVARKLGIDCAPAVVGFDFHCGGSHPMFDGFIVCEEHKDTLLDAWNQEQDEAEKRHQEKLEKRVYGNWRRLIKGLLIRERLKLRYSFGDEAGPSESKKFIVRKKSTKPTPSNTKPVPKNVKPAARKGKQKVVRKRRKISSDEEEEEEDIDDDTDEDDEDYDSGRDWD